MVSPPDVLPLPGATTTTSAPSGRETGGVLNQLRFAAFCFCQRYATNPRPANPVSIVHQVKGNGAAGASPFGPDVISGVTSAYPLLVKAL